MASLKEFSQQPVKTVTSLKDFAAKNPVISDPHKQTEQEIAKEPKGVWGWIGKQLMKGAGVAAKEQRAIGEALGNIISIASPKVSASQGLEAAAKSFLENQKGAWNVLRGKEETTIVKELEEVGGERLTGAARALAIGNEFMIDPLNFIPTAKVSKLVKAVKAAGPIIKAAETIKKVTGTVKEIPVVKKVISAFITKTGNKAFDTVVTKFRNLREYREAGIIDQAVSLGKEIKQITKSGIKNAEELIVEGLENPKSLAGVTDKRIIDIVGNLKTTYADLLKEAKNVGLRVGEIAEYAPHIRKPNEVMNTLKETFGLGAKEWGTAGIEKGRKLRGTIQELTAAGIDIFEKNPIVQLAKKGQTYAKAITSKEFAEAVKGFAVEDGLDVTNPMLKGLKFAPEHAAVIDNFYTGIKPKELNAVIKTFDKVQNWWKANALTAPAYHIRNVAGNIWNNFLAGVKPFSYLMATQLQTGVKKSAELMEEMNKLGVINQGWYAADIGEEVVSKIKSIGNFRRGINPLSRENYLFKLNQKIGTVVENNARMAHYISKRFDGLNPEVAAESVKKYLFDYGDLTSVEKNIFKRALPFYTWTRKNLPLQLSNLITQPQKFVLPYKVQQEIESGVATPNEKYMSDYISNNIPVKIRKNEEGNTEYFLIGNWLPYAAAVQILNKPFQNLVQMTTPMIKTPYEIASGKSTYFKTTLGKAQPIEKYPEERGEFLGQPMKKKTINVLKNIRIINEINKWVDKQDPTATKDSWQLKLLNSLFGKFATYDVEKSKYFYDRDTDDMITSYKNSIKSLQKKGYKEKAKEIVNEMKDFIKTRRGD